MSAKKKRAAMNGEADWERVLSAAAHLQEFVPDAVLVGGTATAILAEHRFSYDDDHVVRDLVSRFASVLEQLELQAGWTTNRIRPPVLILGSFEGVETGIRNLIREAPLETQTYASKSGPIVLPTLAEMARIKAWLVVTRNATRDYIDLVALLDRLERSGGAVAIATAFESMDVFYPQKNGESVLLQLARQLAEPLPADLGDGDLKVYRLIAERWKSWPAVASAARAYAVLLLQEFQK